MSEKNITIEQFETEVKNLLKKPFTIAYESEKKDLKALTIVFNNNEFVDVMQSSWQEVFDSCIRILTEQYGDNQ